jgi:hypothetical protein
MFDPAIVPRELSGEGAPDVMLFVCGLLLAVEVPIGI